MFTTNVPWLMLHMVIENPETNCKLTWSIKTSLVVGLENLVDLKKKWFLTLWHNKDSHLVFMFVTRRRKEAETSSMFPNQIHGLIQTPVGFIYILNAPLRLLFSSIVCFWTDSFDKARLCESHWAVGCRYKNRLHGSIFLKVQMNVL